VDNVTQALVLVGGTASRLKTGGVLVPLTKSFMIVNSKPLLYWNLCSLHQAGIRELIISGDHVRQLYEASKVIKLLPCKFDNIVYFHDEGNGVHGLPYELRYLLRPLFIIDCGHGLSTPAHYKKLMKAKRTCAVVFSGYITHPANIRQPVLLKKGKVYATSIPGKAIAHPIIADENYARELLRLRFKIDTIIQYYSHCGLLRYVKNTLPPEYDVIEEMKEAHDKYHQYITKHMVSWNK
jgi:CTP:phosphocholine cytidylyltransferase-like protein